LRAWAWRPARFRESGGVLLGASRRPFSALL
jgi:hypothetical protein